MYRGFFGFGTAIKKLKDDGRIEEVKDLFRNSDFFKTLVLNSMMAMNKSYFSAYLLHEKSSKFGDFVSFVQ